MPTREPYYVFVDEAGDRGWATTASPVFVLTAVVVRSADEPALRAMLTAVNHAIGRDGGKEIHWTENIRRHDERKFASAAVAALPITVVSVVLHKASAQPDMLAIVDQGHVYMHVLRHLLRRISWLMQDRSGLAHVRLAHIRGMRVEFLRAHLDLLRETPRSMIRWESFSARYPSFDQPANLSLGLCRSPTSPRERSMRPSSLTGLERWSPAT